jgi:hypothetical protein
MGEDPVGVELAGALKNVYAIAAGIADGLGFENNTRASELSIHLMSSAHELKDADSAHHPRPVGDDENWHGVWRLAADFPLACWCWRSILDMQFSDQSELYGGISAW